MIWLLSIVVVGLLVVLGILVAEFRRITRELTYINKHTTNALVTTNTRFAASQQLASAVNHSLEQARTLKQQQRQQDQQVHTLLTNLTHDIKTPLTVATGYVQLMQKAAPDDDRLVRIGHNLTTVNYYLRYLMDFNVLQEQNATFNLSSVALTSFVEQRVFDAYDELTARGLSLTPEITPGVTLITDAGLLQRVIDNLIGNWLKYADGALRLTLTQDETGRTTLVFANHTAQPVAHVEHLSERFYTNDPARQDSTGLGLSIVAALMVRLNGRLTLSAEGNWFVATLVFYPHAGN